jgi:hypothetical protein
MLFHLDLPAKSSKSRRQGLPNGRVAPCPLVILLVGLIASAGITAGAETFRATISVRPAEMPRVLVEGERSIPTRAWSFRNVYANVMGLGNRIEKLTLGDSAGNNIPVRKLAAGEYEADRPAVRFAYEVKLEPPGFETDAAHISWLTAERGFLMLGDLLPLSASATRKSPSAASFKVGVPDGWSMASSAEARSDGFFEVTDSEAAVLFVGRDVRRKQVRIGLMEFALVASGEWAFADDELMKVAVDVLKDHALTFGGVPRAQAMMVLSPFPRAVAAEHWSAETRGSTVTLLSGKLPSKTAALAQLNFPLAHELFHLWIPNALSLEGEYDWFYEGFTLYQALRAGMRLNLLSFQDYLDAIGRAFDGYKTVRERDQFSLIEASRSRWTSSPTLVYNKGMLVACLYDLTLRQQSKGKRSLDDVYKELFRRYHSSETTEDGNNAVVSILKNGGGAEEIVQGYIEGAKAIELPPAIARFGLEIDLGGVRAHISVSNSISGGQRDLLRKFGYNEKTYGVSGHRRTR